MIDVRKNAECHLSLGVASGVAPAEPARIAASVLTGAYSNAVPDPSIAVRASIGARRSAAPDQPTDEHVSFDARKSAAIAYRMLTAALARVAHDPNRNAVFPCHP